MVDGELQQGLVVELSKRRKWTDKQLIDSVAASSSYRATQHKLGLTACGGNAASIKRHIARLKLDTSHFTGRGWNKNKEGRYLPRIPLSDILVDNSTYLWTDALRKRLIHEGLLEEICSGCRIEEWLGYPMPLELDHINGLRPDNRIENLRLLCPNCHALTPTHAGKNKGRVVE